MSDPSAQSHTNEARHIISETESLRAELTQLRTERDSWKGMYMLCNEREQGSMAERDRLRADPYAWYESAQRVNAELRERAEVAEYVAWRWWKQARQNNYDAWQHLRNWARTLQAREDLQKLVVVLIQAIEIDHDYGCECSACRAIAEHRKVASDAIITQGEA